MKVGLTLPREASKVSALQEHIENATSIANRSGFAKGEGFISNSYLSALQAILLNRNKFYGSDEAFMFGVEQHKRMFKPNEKRIKMTPELEQLSKDMLKVAKKDPLLQRFMSETAKRERVTVRQVGQAFVKVILDSRIGKEAIDYKTTSATTQAEFEASIVRYDYPRQGWIYCTAEGIEQFTFVGQSKKKPHNIFYAPMHDPKYKDLVLKGCMQYNHLVDVHRSLQRYYDFIRNNP